MFFLESADFAAGIEDDDADGRHAKEGMGDGTAGIAGSSHQDGEQAVVVAGKPAHETGHEAGTKVFEGEYCYWRYTGKTKWNSEIVLEDLGKTWMSQGIIFKPWPIGL